MNRLVREFWMLLILLAVFIPVKVYGESCPSHGVVEYTPSGCSDTSRICCYGVYTSWGSTYCPSCSSSQCYNGSSCSNKDAVSRNCSGNVSGACSGTQTRTATCNSGSGWSYGSWTGTCSYTQSCTATSTACSNVSSSYCSGTATRSVTGTCGSCSYGSWSTGSCKATQSCTATSRSCSGNVSGACAGTQTRSVTGTCGSCSYGSWTGTCSYTQSCTATSTACSNVSSSYCSGTATRSVTGTCGSCSYGSWSTGSCKATQNCTVTSRLCSGNVANATSGTQTRSVTGTCGSCSYGAWSGSCGCASGYYWASDNSCKECGTKPAKAPYQLLGNTTPTAAQYMEGAVMCQFMWRCLNGSGWQSNMSTGIDFCGCIGGYSWNANKKKCEKTESSGGYGVSCSSETTTSSYYYSSASEAVSVCQSGPRYSERTGRLGSGQVEGRISSSDCPGSHGSFELSACTSLTNGNKYAYQYTSTVCSCTSK